jgi:UDP-glucose 4-epimerase
VEIGGRRAGDPAALVANVDRIRKTLDWRPQFQDLDMIVAHALAWESRLPGKREAVAG